MENKKISILMPVYNAMPLLKASIKSLIMQTYPFWECIIVNDGSSDGTTEYLDSLNDKRFIVFHLDKNYGRPYARQKALNEAQGYYVAMLDAEDFYHPQKLELQIKEFQKNSKIVLVGSKMCSFGTQTSLNYARGTSVKKSIKFKGENVPSHAPSMLLASLAKKVQYNPKLTLGQDVDFLEKYLENSEYVVLPNILYYYSELDSVTKKKIKRTYRLCILKYLKQGLVKKTFIYMLKFCFSVFLYPFFDIEQILKKRGFPLSLSEKKEFVSLYKEMVEINEI